jgi:hypothetical protein
VVNSGGDAEGSGDGEDVDGVLRDEGNLMVWSMHSIAS